MQRLTVTIDNLHVYVAFVVIEIDLKAPYFQPGRNNYERVRKCFSSNHTQFYNVVFTWKPAGMGFYYNVVEIVSYSYERFCYFVIY